MQVPRRLISLLEIVLASKAKEQCYVLMKAVLDQIECKYDPVKLYTFFENSET